LKVFARDFLDEPRIGLQRPHLIAKVGVFLIQPVQVFFHAIDFSLRAPHGNKPVRPKNVVNHKRQNEEAQNRAAMPFQKCAEPSLRFRLF